MEGGRREDKEGEEEASPSLHSMLDPPLFTIHHQVDLIAKHFPPMSCSFKLAMPGWTLM